MPAEPTVPVDTCSMAGPNGSRIPTEEPHAWVSRKGPDNIWVRTCHRCPAIDWDDLREGVLTYAATLTLTPSPASMGGPLSEAERIAEIQARLDAFHLHAGRPPWDEHVSRNRAALERNAPGDLAHLLSRVGVLEGQLATAQALHQPYPEGGQGYDEKGNYTYIEPCCQVCGTADEFAVRWPCGTARALGVDGGESDAE